MAGQRKTASVCKCSACRFNADPSLVEYHLAINRVLIELDERGRRLFVGLLAKQMGRGGIQRLTEITGLCRMTIRRGLREIKRLGRASSGRVRRVGGGRQAVEKKVRSCCEF